MKLLDANMLLSNAPSWGPFVVSMHAALLTECPPPARAFVWATQAEFPPAVAPGEPAPTVASASADSAPGSPDNHAQAAAVLGQPKGKDAMWL